MINFLAQYGGSIAVAIVLIAIVAAIIYSMLRNKKKGKNSCGGSCGGCPSAGVCHSCYPDDSNESGKGGGKN